MLDCTSGWEYLASTGKCYKVIRSKVIWEMARLACQKFASTGDLVSIPNAEVNQFILDTLVSTGEDYWTGGHQDQASDTDPSANWVWTDGSGVVYTSWSRNEPDDLGPGCKSNCDHMVWSRGEWTDRTKMEKNNYICQYDSTARRKKRNSEITMNQVFLGDCIKQRKKREGKSTKVLNKVM